MKEVNSDIALDYIRKRILNGEFPPGYDLITKKLSDEIGVSRTPVRDALRQLEAEGLVTIKARLGASVATMNLKKYYEMCGLRLALESYAAGLAAQNRTTAELREIRFALESMKNITERLIAAGEDTPLGRELAREHSREDVRFHIAIITAAKNDSLKEEIIRLHIVNRVVFNPKSAPDSTGQQKAEREAHRRSVIARHEEIYKAIETENAAAAKIAMERHIQERIDSNVPLFGRNQGGTVARDLTEDELSYTS